MGRQRTDRARFWQMYSSAGNGFCAEASSRITLSRVRITVWSTDSGSSAGDMAVWRSVTSTWPRPVVRSERILRRGVIKDHALPRPDHGVEHGFGKLGRGHGRLAQRDLNLAAAGRQI